MTAEWMLLLTAPEDLCKRECRSSDDRAYWTPESANEVQRVQSEPMCMADQALEFTTTDAENVLDGVVEFINDDEGGLGSIYNLVGELSAVQN